MVIGYGCCVGTMEKYQRYVLPRIDDAMCFALTNQSCIATAYNTIIGKFRVIDDVEALVLLHDDLEIIDPNFESKIRAVMDEEDVALIGVAGGRGAETLAWWNYQTVGHQLTDSGMLTFIELTGDVEVLEGSILVLTRWAIENLKFDERYGGFHGYDDIGYEAVSRGKRVVVADIDTHHHTTLGWKSHDKLVAWAAANEKFREKWHK